MATRLGRAIQCLRVATKVQEELSDGQLLQHFIDQQDESAFDVLVRRHGPLVWGVCSRTVGHRQDAEDAFQATFLVLARKAASIQRRELLANWLHGVAHRTSMRVKSTARRRLMKERQWNDVPEPTSSSPDAWDDLAPLIDQELANLPEKYRIAVLLCDLQGKTGKEVAKQLRIPEGTLSSRLRTGRVMLAKRLARHGLSLSGGALATVLSQHAVSAAVPTTVLSSTIQAAPAFAAGGTAVGMVTDNVVTLMEGVIKGMLLTKLKTIMKVVLLLGVATFGGDALFRTEASGQAVPVEQKRVAPPRKEAAADLAGVVKSTPSEHKPLPKAVPGRTAPAKDAIRAKSDDIPRQVAYAVADLVVPIRGLDPSAVDKKAPTKEDWLIRKITQTVAPASWNVAGGEGRIQYYPKTFQLVINNSAEVQAQVHQLLETMRRVQDIQLTVDTRFLSIDAACYAKLQKLLARPKPESCVVITQKESEALMTEAQKNRLTNVLQAPKFTFFPGQTVNMFLEDKVLLKKESSAVTLTGFVAGNLQLIHLEVEAKVNQAEFKQARRMQDGEVLVCFERAGDGYVTLMLTPRVILSLEADR